MFGFFCFFVFFVFCFFVFVFVFFVCLFVCFLGGVGGGWGTVQHSFLVIAETLNLQYTKKLLALNYLFFFFVSFLFLLISNFSTSSATLTHICNEWVFPGKKKLGFLQCISSHPKDFSIDGKNSPSKICKCHLLQGLEVIIDADLKASR